MHANWNKEIEMVGQENMTMDNGIWLTEMEI